MAFDESLAARVRGFVTGDASVVEKRMFGGLAFLASGNMSVGVHGAELIVRIDPAECEAALQLPGVRVFDITGKPMKGWLLVSSEGLPDKKALGAWVKRGLNYAKTLPPK